MKIKVLILILMTLSFWGCSSPSKVPLPTESEMPTDAPTEAATEAIAVIEPTEVVDPKIIEAIVRMDNSYTEAFLKETTRGHCHFFISKTTAQQRV